MIKIKDKIQNKKSMVLLTMTIIAVLIVLFNLGRSVIFPVPWNQKYEDDGSAMRIDSENGSVIIDKAYSRLSFQDKKGKICNVIDGEGLALRRFYQQAVSNGDTYYVIDTEFGSDSIYTKNEHIIAYDKDGHIKNTLYSADYQKENEERKIFHGLVKRIKVCDGGIIALFYDPEYMKVTVHQFSNSGEDKIIDEITLPEDFTVMIAMDYNLTAHKFACASFYGKVFEHAGDDESITPMFTSLMENYPGQISISDSGEVSVQKIPESNIPESSAYTFLFGVEKLAFWIALAYLVVLLLYEVSVYLKKLSAEGKEQTILYFGFVIAIVALIVGISWFYSHQIEESNYNSRMSELSSLTVTLAKDPENILANVAEEEDLKDDIFHERTYDIQRYFYLICDHNSNNDSNYFLNLYKRMDDGRVLLLCSIIEASDKVPWISDSKVLSKLDRDEIYNTTYTAEAGENMVSVAALKNNNGKVVGYIESGSNMGVMSIGQFRQLMTIFVALLTLVVGITLFFIELRGIKKARKKRQVLLEESHPHPEIAHFRSMRLCVEFILKFDSVLMILISKDLLVQNGITDIALLVGLPASLMGVGMLVGQMLSDILLPRVYVKRVILSAALLNALVFIATAFVIIKGSFWGYCVGILLANVCFGVMAGPSLIMPFYSGDEKKRYEMNNEKSMAGISASVISVMLAGIVAERFGNYAIYIFALLPLAGVLFICMRVFPKDTYYQKAKTETDTIKLSAKEYVKFLLSPAILILILLVLIPSNVAGGYKSFFFPLLSQDYGLQKDFISNLVVLANFTVFLINKPISRLIKKDDYWFNTVLFVGLCGLIFFSFKFNNSIIWSVIVIVLIAIPDKFLDPNISMLWPRQCMAKGLPPEKFNSMFIYIGNIISSIRPTIMGAFLILGTPQSCIWLGISIIVCAILFAILTSRSAMRTYKKKE